MTKKNKIDFCLLIPCYNNLDGLIVSLSSVEYPDGPYLILVVDDGSTDPVTIDKVYENIDRRIPIFVSRNEKNYGITATLNSGLRWIEENTDTKYIARLDCGDRCVPERFVKQVGFMNENPGIGLVGTWCKLVDDASAFSYSYVGPTDHRSISRDMYNRNVFMHATVMFRAGMLKKVGYYPTNFELAEDYAFFWKLINEAPAAIIGEFLVICELNKKGLSYRNRGKQLFARARVIKTFGKSIVLKFVAYMRLLLLFILPKRVTLQLKKWRG